MDDNYLDDVPFLASERRCSNSSSLHPASTSSTDSSSETCSLLGRFESDPHAWKEPLQWRLSPPRPPAAPAVPRPSASLSDAKPGGWRAKQLGVGRRRAGASVAAVRARLGVQVASPKQKAKAHGPHPEPPKYQQISAPSHSTSEPAARRLGHDRSLPSPGLRSPWRLVRPGPPGRCRAWGKEVAHEETRSPALGPANESL